MTTALHTARLNFRLPADLKQAIEDAAALAGQTVSDFAISALTQSARTVIKDQDSTVLNKRDRALFVKLLDRAARPNKALAAAARRYKKIVGK